MENIAPLSLEDPRPRVALYARVSLDRRERASVEEQLADLHATIKRLGWVPIAELADNDVPASRYSREDRPAWLQLLRLIRSGALDAVGFWELSRSTRRRVEWAEFAELAIDHRLRILVGSSVYNADNPNEMHILDMMATQGILEVGQSSKRLRRFQRANAEQGRPAGVPGYGYRRRYDPATGRLIGQEPDPAEAEVVRMVAQWIKAGWSINRIAGELNRRRIPTERGRLAGERYVDSRGRERVALGWV
ncbi:MAG: recombinase family protein, partial [Microbispora sp.]|nr:recombinase family protein [Microbispora sp.]